MKGLLKQALRPLQNSAGLHGPRAARQSVPAGFNASGGQAAVTPSQTSTGSHRVGWPARHIVPAGSSASGGQPTVRPSQRSGGSQPPADGRQTTVPAGLKGCLQRPAIHTSSVHTNPSFVHVVPSGTNASGGQAGVRPSQNSRGSQGPADARHANPTGMIVF